MKPSKILLASVFLTAIIIVVIGAVTRIVMASSTSKNSGADVSAATIQAYQQREAGYNQLIQQANQQIEEANARLQAAQSQPALPQQSAFGAASSAAASNAPANAAVSPDKAEQIARQAADPGQTSVKPPELVNFQGKVAYEVAFPKGSIYIDSQTGAVLFNGTVPQTITLDKATQIAADYMKDTAILQADQITFRNAPLYRVIFKSGMMVYIDTTGQIIYILKSSPRVVVVDAGGNSSSSPAASGQQPPSQPPNGYGEDNGGNVGGEN